MTYLQTILAALETPDAQKRDWYGWATNQMSHALMGVIIALVLSLQAVLLVAAIKEICDLMRAPSVSTLKDCGIDITFWLIGGLIVTLDQPYTGVVLLCAGLALGVRPRIRRAREN